MAAPQFFVTPGELTPRRARVRGDDARHAATVLRLKVGERVVVAERVLPASLGHAVLRAETAMIATVAAVRFHYGLLG